MTNRFGFFVAFSVLLIISCNNKPESVASESKETLPEQFKIEIHDSIAVTLVDSNATFEILAWRFFWSEGPLWIDELQAVIFSDVPAEFI